MQLLFDKFAELGSANAVLRFFRKEGIRIGVRQLQGADRGLLVWRAPNRSTITRILHHPIYAGAYVFGLSRTDLSRRAPGKPSSGRRSASPDEWRVLLRDKLPAYITWEQWEKNQRRLRGDAPRSDRGQLGERRHRRTNHLWKMRGTDASVVLGAQKALLQLLCTRMNFGEPLCQSFEASSLESLIEQLVLTALKPASVELSLQATVAIELEREAEKHHLQSVQRATCDAGLARRRYEEVNPSNRLVAAELEKRWESSLQTQRKAEER